MRKRADLFFVVMLFSCFACAQRNNANKIFTYTKDSKNFVVTVVLGIKEPWGRLGKYLVVVDANGKKTRVRKDAIWGYQKTKNKFVRRLYEGETYELLHSGLVAFYKRCATPATFFFSTDVNSPVLPLEKKKLLNEIGADRFIRLMRQAPEIMKFVN